MQNNVGVNTSIFSSDFTSFTWKDFAAQQYFGFSRQNLLASTKQEIKACFMDQHTKNCLLQQLNRFADKI